MGENKQRGNTRNPDAGMCFFYDWIDQIKCIRSKAARYELIEAMIEFARSGKNPPEFRDAVSRAVAIGIFKQMERSKTYAENAKKRVNKGNSGDIGSDGNGNFADSKADSNADSIAESIAASIADTHNGNGNKTKQNNNLSVVGGGIDQSITEPTRPTKNANFYRPSREEAIAYGVQIGLTRRSAEKCFDLNAGTDWQPIRKGEAQDWKAVYRAWWDSENKDKPEYNSISQDHESSYETDEFLDLALKRSFL